jgi:glycosyltransferase involved in cell wall biosynthesis
MADALLEILSLGPAERRALGAAARDHVRASYDIEGVAQAFERLQAEVLARG